MPHKPADLLEVNGLEITRLGHENVVGAEGTEPRWICNNTVVFVPEGMARRLAKLWRNLPAGSQAKCWAPTYRLRFFANETTLVDALVCWYCSTIQITEEKEHYKIGFDPSAPASQKLLQLLNEIFPEQSPVELYAVRNT